jgi:hypothetical protein
LQRELELIVMRRFLIGQLLTLALLFHSSLGYSQGLMTLGAGSVGAVAGSSFDPATTVWVNAVVVAGGSVSAPRKTIVDTYIKCLKSNSLFTVLDRYWLLAGENTQSANIDMINLGTWTANGTITFSANNGYTGDGSTGYLETGFVPSTAGGHYQQNSASLFAYVLTSRTTIQNYAEIGTDDAGDTSYTDIFPLNAGPPQGTFQINGVTIGGTNPVTNNGRASWIITTNAGPAQAAYQYASGGLTTTTSTTVTGGISSTSIVIAARRLYGNVGAWSADQIAAAGFGGGMNSTQAGNFETCQNAMMTSIGINVH